MSDLVSYTLELMVGGNTADNSETLQTIGNANASVASGQAEDTIPTNIAQSVENGFYLRMTSNDSSGNQVINYSDRFTLISMNGATDAKYLNGANAAAGVTDVPEAQYNVISPPSSTSSATSATSSTSASASSTATITASSTPTPTPSDAPQPPVATGLIAGLSIGLLAALIIIVGMAIWALVRWRKRRRQQKQPKVISSPPDSTFLGDKAELPASSTINLTSPMELSPTEERYEVEAHDKAVEADGTTEFVYELEGDWNGWEAGNGRRSQAYDPTR